MAYLGNSSITAQNVQPATDFFSGNGVAVSFTLSRAVVSTFTIDAVVNNVQQNPATAYTVSGNTITFTSAPPSGFNNIYVNYNSLVGQQVAIGQGTVGPTQLSNGGPTWDVNGNLTVGGTLISLILENVQPTSYTLALSDRGLVVAMNNASAATVTVPPDSSVLFPIGTILYICRVGAGTVTLAAGAGVSLSKLGTFAPSEQITLRKRAANTWIIIDSPSSPSATGGTITNAAGYRIITYPTAGGSGTLTVG